ncbi:molybdopterin-dependent oxidoreductase [Nocardioides marmorisolisilvae]|uniref:Molybdopterin-binding protein n=1 Tax=Nocardioides marmorisolisilvae TaxID=1542737 RepID=A0A3N0DU02_9ACTN|nr:molybdopterin-dependent oxidoreductase [Nocardioides marmorisolisilvae]RNL79001.1 molybdopterin-binding protein [Nocardioides marmorisolisilvae]
MKLEALAPPREADFTSRLRSPAVAARVGVWLGICFVIAFVTGLISHEAHVTHPFVGFPTRPVWLYRWTQALHVASGTAAIPLLLVKLWSVFPKLFARPPRRITELAVESLERGSIAVLVGAAIFQLASGVANTAQWYPWGFHFRATHYAMAWIALGALAVHVAVKLPLIRSVLGSPIESAEHDRPSTAESGPLDRRTLVRGSLLAAGVAVLATAGSAVPVLRRVSVFGVRSGGGPGGVPINKSARAADVVAAALSPSYRLTVRHGARSVELSRADLEGLRQRTGVLPIACVEGWSANGTWDGVRLRDLLDLVGAPRGRDVRFTSLQQHGPYKVTTLPSQFADDPLTLVALGLDGEKLALDHGYPCRLIAPDRPGVLQTKWLDQVEVL